MAECTVRIQHCVGAQALTRNQHVLNEPVSCDRTGGRLPLANTQTPYQHFLRLLLTWKQCVKFFEPRFPLPPSVAPAEISRSTHVCDRLSWSVLGFLSTLTLKRMMNP